MSYFNINSLLLFDPLSLFFLFIIAIISLPAAVYSIGYLKGDYPVNKIILNWVLFPVFVISMALVVTVSNAFQFLIVWEIMSLVSYFLVIFDSEHKKSVRAGLLYIVMTHIGTAFITFAFLLIFKYAHSFDFSAFQEAANLMPRQTKDLAFLFFLIGFGAKAGIVPLHIWLPYAHPQAPSHISSVMSSVMIKTAIYGLLRFIVFILGVESAWWGNLILVLAIVSCLTGIMYALAERDLKKLLAYSSVENIGMILFGIGASLAFIKMDLPVLSVLALTAGLYHLINHAIFKGLLFLSAGSIYKACGVRDMEKLGGLIKLMPVTAVCFLIGSMAISAIPPLNGFVSEWLTLQAFFLGAINTSGGFRIFMGLCASVLALTGGLACACFVKAFGVTMLALPRSFKAGNAREVSLSMKVPVVFLSLLAIFFGIMASAIIKVLVKVSGCVIGIDTAGINFSLNNFILAPAQGSGACLAPAQGSGACLSAPLMALMLIAAVLFIYGIFRFALSKNRIRIGKTWDCGYYNLSSRNEYTATAFSKPFRIAFSFFLFPYRKTEKIRDSFYHVRSFKYEVFTTPVFKRYIYEPLLSIIFRIAELVKRIQPGSIHLYISYIFITILFLIIFMNRF